MQIRVINHGTVCQFWPRDDEAKQFLREVGAEGWQYMGHTLVMDWRVARGFIEQTSGLVDYVEA